VDGNPDRTRLVRDRPRYGLTDPPRGVRGEFEAALRVELLHGAEEAAKAEQVSQVLFGEGTLEGLDADALQMLKAGAPSREIQTGTGIVDALVVARLASSKREARQFLADESVLLNGDPITDPSETLGSDDFYNGLALLKRGKRNICVLILK